MKFELPIEEGVFLKRYKRFFADVKRSSESEILVAHVPNTGSLLGCLLTNSPCRFTLSDDPKRKLKLTLQMIRTPQSWVGINTNLPNALVWEAWEQGKIKHWQKFAGGQREVKINTQSRIDLVLWKKQEGLGAVQKVSLKDFNQYKFHFVEIKNVTLAEKGTAYFPDAVTTRGQKHLSELMELLKTGHTAEMFYVVQRTDCKTFAPADHIDPTYGQLLRQAHKLGLKISAFPCHILKQEIKLNTDQPLNVKL